VNPGRIETKEILMRGAKELIETLNENLACEVTAIAQYSIHAEMAEVWGYDELAEEMMKAARAEMKHMANLVHRILELEGDVEIKMKTVKLGKNVKEMIELLIEAEEDAIKDYNEAIILAHDLKDNGTNHILKKHSEDEEEHLAYWKSQQAQIKQMGIEGYLSTKVD
jgi:bacterioferritin